jgi:hypothetical protein
MLKISAPRLTALFITTSLQSHSQILDAGTLDRQIANSGLADARIDLKQG